MNLRLASDLTLDSIVDGPGLRMVIWTQGCIHHCYKCHNPQTHRLDGGIIVNTDYIIRQIKKLKLHRGITLSGGEPFLQAGALSQVAKSAKEYGLDVWCYTGFLFEELISKANPLYRENIKLLNYVDVLVDGQFDESKKVLNLKFRGSTNQRIIDLNKTRLTGKIIEKTEFYK